MAPRIITVACIIEIIVLLAHGILALFYEIGASRWISFITSICVALSFFLFLRRYRWTWRFARVFTVLNPVLYVFFPPSEKYLGTLTEPARILVVIQLLACCVIFLAMLFPTTRRWFFGDQEDFDHANDSNFHSGETLQVIYQKNFWDMVWYDFDQALHTPSLYILGGIILLSISFFVFDVLSRYSYPALAKILTYLVISTATMTILTLGWILLTLILLVVNHLKNKIKYRGVDQNCTLSVSESGVAAESVTGRTQLRWPKITKVRQTRSYILLYLSARAALLIPRRVFTDNTKAEQFFETAHRFWENSKNTAILK